MKTYVRRVASLLVCMLMVTSMPCNTVQGAKTAKLNKTSMHLPVGKTYTLKVSNYNGKVSWKSGASSKVKILSKGKNKAKIKAIKSGTVKIYAKCGKKSLCCKVIVDKIPATNQPIATATMKPTATPKPTKVPVVDELTKYLTDQAIIWDGEKQAFVFQFAITLSDHKTRKNYAGNVDLKITNSSGDIVYNKNLTFTTEDYVSLSAEGEQVCKIFLPVDDISLADVTVGELSYSINLDDGTWFSKRKMEVVNLPLRPTPTATARPTNTPCITASPTTKPTVKPTVSPTRAPLPTLKPVVTANSRDKEMTAHVEILKKYLVENGVREGSIYYYQVATLDGYRYRISYFPDTDDIQYLANFSDEQRERTIYLEYNPVNSDKTSLHLVSVGVKGQDINVGACQLNASQLLGGEQIRLTNFGDVTDGFMVTGATYFFYESMIQWNDMLWNTGITLQDVGFDNWGYKVCTKVDTPFTRTETIQDTDIYFLRIKRRILTNCNRWDQGQMVFEDENGRAEAMVNDQNNQLKLTFYSEGMETRANLTLKPGELQHVLVTVEWKNGMASTYFNVEEIVGNEVLAFENLSSYEEADMQVRANEVFFDALHQWSVLVDSMGIAIQRLGLEQYRAATWPYACPLISPTPQATMRPTPTLTPTLAPTPQIQDTVEPTITPRPTRPPSPEPTIEAEPTANPTPDVVSGAAV